MSLGSRLDAGLAVASPLPAPATGAIRHNAKAAGTELGVPVQVRQP
jgi:hypothetical protein